MAEFTVAKIAAGLRTLRGTVTPSGFDRALVKLIKERDYARFTDRPAPHWALTQRGRDWLAENNEREWD